MNKDKPFVKGDIIEVDIIDINEDGTAVAKYGDFIVFVNEGVPGDILSVKITKVKKNYAEAVMRRIEYYSKGRKYLEELCIHQKFCGGCTFGEMTYEAQLKIKERHLRQKLARVGGLKEPLIEDIIPSPSHEFYRNKATLALEEDESGNIRIGFYQRKSHRVIDLDVCMIQHSVLVPITEALRKFMMDEDIHVFNPVSEKGIIRNMIVKTAFGTGQVMVILGVNGKELAGIEKLAYLLDEAVYSINGNADVNEAFGERKVLQSHAITYSLESLIINDMSLDEGLKGKTGERFITVAGKNVIEDVTSEGLKYEISAEAFYQVNPAQTENLYRKAIEYAGLKGGENILDLYCGIGTIGITALSYIGFEGKVIGIEASERAVRDANRNAVINKVVDARYIAGKAENVLCSLQDENDGELHKLMEEMKIEKFDVAFLDPPRAGCKEELLQSLARAGIDKIVYISCDAATLSRDIKYLCDNGYEFKKATPVDMFCQTGRLEAVTLLGRRV